MDKPFSPSCERNKQPILQELKKILATLSKSSDQSRKTTVLEIGSGTGQHSIFFSKNFPNIIWQPSDVADNGVGNCTLCHTGAALITNSATINLTAPMDYELNTTYPITVSTNSAAARQGFQLSVEDGRDNKVGDLTDDGSSSQVFDLGRGEAITHTGSGAFQNSWTFDWISPATDVGPVTFYVALNESNQDFNTTGDQIHLKQSQSNLLSVESAVFKEVGCQYCYLYE